MAATNLPGSRDTFRLHLSYVRQLAPGVGAAIHVLWFGFNLRYQFDQMSLVLPGPCLQSLNVPHLPAQRVGHSDMFPAGEVARQQHPQLVQTEVRCPSAINLSADTASFG